MCGVSRPGRVFNQNHQSNHVSIACKKFLSTKTLDCLDHVSFLHINPCTLKEFLKLGKMKVDSEKVVVDACLKFVTQKEHEHYSRKLLFREIALPHLRLLTLRLEDIADVFKFLTSEELAFILKPSRKSLAAADAESIPADLCPSLDDRNPKHNILNFVQSSEILDLKKLLETGQFAKLKDGIKYKFVLSFSTKACIKISGIELFGNFDCDLFSADGMPKVSASDGFDGWKNMIVKLKVDHEYFSESTILEGKPGQRDTSIYYDQSVFVPLGSRVTIKVVLNSFYVRKIIAKDVLDSLLARNEGADEVFQDINIQLFTISPTHGSLEYDVDQALCVFKCLHYSLMP